VLEQLHNAAAKPRLPSRAALARPLAHHRPRPPALRRVALCAVCSSTQAKIVRQNWVKLGMLMTINGGLAALASYLIGWGLQQAVDGKVCL